MSKRAIFTAFKWQLPPTQKLVAIFVANQVRDDGQCFFSLATAQIFTSLSARAIREAIQKLEAADKLRRIHRPGRVNLIEFNFAQDDQACGKLMGGVAAGAGGVAAGATPYIEKNSYLPILPSQQERLYNRMDKNPERRGRQPSPADIGKLTDNMLVKLAQANHIQTSGLSRQSLMEKLRHALN